MSAGQDIDHRDQPLHRVQRTLAVCAALAAVPMVWWELDVGMMAGLHLFIAPFIAIPLIPRRGQDFVMSCRIVGISLFPLGVIGVFWALWSFWPSALLLLLAALGDPRKSPVAAWVSGIIGALVFAGVAALTAWYAWHVHVGPALARPHTFRTETDTRWFHTTSTEARERLRPYGATIHGTGSGGRAYLHVRFPDDLSEERRAQLKEQIAQLPGIHGAVELCSVRVCG
ncbi:hypothetical protein [Streptomyces sp. NPDC059874]|uniref:hypothetical protein n=1 Tax=Streptomyces sp. NPDC059874 TaxID=3346983 RepID=UPI00364A8E3A